MMNAFWWKGFLPFFLVEPVSQISQTGVGFNFGVPQDTLIHNRNHKTKGKTEEQEKKNSNKQTTLESTTHP